MKNTNKKVLRKNTKTNKNVEKSETCTSAE